MATWADNIVLKFDWRHTVKRELSPFCESIIKPTASFIRHRSRGIENIFKHIFPKLRWCSREAFTRRIYYIYIHDVHVFFQYIQIRWDITNICIKKQVCIQTPHDNNTIIIGYIYNKKKTIVNTHVDFSYLFFYDTRHVWVSATAMRHTQRDVYQQDIARRIEDKRPC